VHTALPATAKALAGWSQRGLPDEAAFAALQADLIQAKGSEELAAAAKRLKMERTGMRSLIMNSARKLAAEPPSGPAKAALIEMDARWGESDTWQLVARNARPHTDHYLLTALDLRRDEAGNIVGAPEGEGVFLDVFGRTLWISFVVTLCCCVLGFPVAYLLARLPARTSNLLMICVLLPFWTSILVRVAAWIVILQDGGLVNQALMALGVIDQPLHLVFNRIGVYISMVHILLPFMILPLYSVMKGISPVYLRAAVSLGCPPFKSFWKVYFPMTVPGLAAGGIWSSSCPSATTSPRRCWAGRRSRW
jgi:putative spermidine/putrescine transport system permease protein